MMSDGCAAYRRLHVRRDAVIKPPSLASSFRRSPPSLVSNERARAHPVKPHQREEPREKKKKKNANEMKGTV